MPSILVVDDSPIEREMAGRILRSSQNWTVTLAASAAEALSVLDNHSVDLLVTDLKMPEMDGLGLLDEVRTRHPQVPVIIMTSKGSEEVAVQALQRGAASYIPKKRLARDLAEIVQGVLAVSRQARKHDAFMECMTQTEFAFELPNDRELVPEVVNYLVDHAMQLEVFDGKERTRVAVALEEAVVNALIHGNLEVSSELREKGNDEYNRLIARRRHESPYKERRIQIEGSVNHYEAVFVIRDEGPGFDPSGIPDPTDLENLDKPSGRGLMLMRAFMDEVSHNETGNEITLVKVRENVTCAAENDVSVELSDESLLAC